MINDKNLNKIGIVGAGTMGNGIAHTSAFFGHKTIIVDLKDEYVNDGLLNIKKNLGRQLKKDLITLSEMESAISNISTSTDYNSLSEQDIVIEAATENEEIKLSIFEKLDKICKSETILATNTSSISINKIASATKRPDKIIGMHFMNPVPIMKLVEVVNGKFTSSLTTQAILDLTRFMNKVPVECNDSPGFISNRILMPMINEAIFCLQEDVGTPEAIDAIMKLGMAHPMGPLALADLIGLDVCLNILNVLYNDFKNEKYSPCSLLIDKVGAGSLGRKSGNGFYNYNT